jgi:hypothetical protein
MDGSCTTTSGTATRPSDGGSSGGWSTAPRGVDVPCCCPATSTLWRFLDRAANSLDHVVWADVTHRGYGIVDITPDEVRVDVWFVHPYDQDPAAEAAWAAGFTTAASGWPPRFVAATTPPPRESARPDLPAGLPPRPGDLARIRRHRRVRIASKATAAAAAVVGVAAGVALVAIRRTR